MKHIVILGDGMADYAIPQLDNKSPLQYCNKPSIDFLAQNGKVGMVKTIPEGIPPGSDAANLSVMGYNPELYYTGRSPLEAVSMGVELSNTDIAFRCNLVTLSEDDDYTQKTMIDYSSDEISTEEAAELIEAVNKYLKTDSMIFHPGISYRHCMVWSNGPDKVDCTPPHDILEKKVTDYLPKGGYGKILLDMMIKSNKFLSEHPINKNRIAKGLRPANSIWLWGEGKKPAIPKFFDKYGVKGAVISAVDLIKGIGICAGLQSIDVEGATGNIHTNFSGKAKAAFDALKSGLNFVYLHVEAPDECGHRYEIDNKVKSIELIDEKIVQFLLKELEQFDDYKLLILPDHPTPLSLRTHTREPVPFIMYQKSLKAPSGVSGYDEVEGAKTGIYIEEGYTLMDMFLKT